MPAKSEKQKKFFGAVMGAKKGQKGVKGAAKKTAKKMTKKEIKKYLKKESFNDVYYKLISEAVSSPKWGHKVGDVIEQEGGSWIITGIEMVDWNKQGPGYYARELRDEGIFIPKDQVGHHELLDTIEQEGGNWIITDIESDGYSAMELGEEGIFIPKNKI